MRDSARGLRLTLLIGFGGMLAIFLVAGVDAIRLLGRMRAENRIRRDASLDRSHRLATIRSYVILSQTYVGDYYMDPDAERARQHQAQIEQTWSRILSSLADYRGGSVEEIASVGQLRQMLDREGGELKSAMERRQRAEFLPVRSAMVEITTRVEDVDAQQLAAAESAIERDFEETGGHLTVVLEIAIGSAVLLALGCILYISRIERQNRRRYQETVEARTALGQLSARLVSMAQEEERRSISRELHDEVGQTLTAVIVDVANLANRLPAEDAVSRRYLENIRSYADRSVNSIRNIALLLRPSMLDDLGLIPALEWQAREVSRRNGVQVKVNAENVPDALPDSVRTCVYRVVQEALTNISRHSGAKNAMVSVRGNEAALSLKIEDDGSGFDPSRTKGLGLLGMEERVKQLDGRFEVHSRAGAGTTVSVTLPIPNSSV